VGIAKAVFVGTTLNVAGASTLAGITGTFNGTVGATTPAAGSFTTLSATGTLSGGTSGTGYSFSGSAPATSLTLNSSGNLGLGVTPSAWSGFRALQIGSTTSLWSGTSGNASSFYTNNGYYNGTNRIYLTNGFATEYIQGQGQHIWYNAPSGTAGNAITFTQAMTLDASGNLGIGTTSPNQTGFTAPVLSITNGTSGIVELIGTQAANGTIGQIAFYNTSSSVRIAQILGLRSGANNSGALTFQTNNAGTLGEVGRFDSSGNLLVGTTSVLGTSNGAILSVKAFGSSNTYFATVMQDSAGGSLFSVRSDGLFTTGVGSLSPYNNTTASVANVFVDSSGNLYRGGVSALKYKQDVRDLESIDINKFRAVRYKSKCANDDQTIDHFGFIADEVDAAGIKELVSYENGVIEGFQYDRMTTVLVKAIQEQQAIITALTTRITALEAK
jgi:hypothetical protein